jgi:transcriptional regulator with XRE-family HTH domain
VFALWGGYLGGLQPQRALKNTYGANVSQVLDKKQEKNKIIFRIKAKMESLGWNNAELSRHCGVPAASIGRLLSGSVNFKVESLEKIVSALSIPLMESSPPVESSKDLSLYVQSIEKRIDDLKTRIDEISNAAQSRINAQGNALQGLQDDCLEIKNKLLRASSRGDIRLLG